MSTSIHLYPLLYLIVYQCEAYIMIITCITLILDLTFNCPYWTLRAYQTFCNITNFLIIQTVDYFLLLILVENIFHTFPLFYPSPHLASRDSTTKQIAPWAYDFAINVGAFIYVPSFHSYCLNVS